MSARGTWGTRRTSGSPPRRDRAPGSRSRSASCARSDMAGARSRIRARGSSNYSDAVSAKSADEILGLEFDWLASDADGHVALFSTAGGGFAPDEFLSDTDAHDRAID